MRDSGNLTKMLLGLALCLATFLLCAPALTPGSARGDSDSDDSKSGAEARKSLGGKPGLDEDEAEVIKQRILRYQRRHGAIDPELGLRRVRQENEAKEAERAARLAGKLAGEPAWVALGPTNGAGRMTTIAPHPTAVGTLYVGADGGGVWKTTDGGNSWVTLGDSRSE